MYGFKWGMSPPAHNIVFVSHTLITLARLGIRGRGGARAGGAQTVRTENADEPDIEQIL